MLIMDARVRAPRASFQAGATGKARDTTVSTPVALHGGARIAVYVVASDRRMGGFPASPWVLTISNVANHGPCSADPDARRNWAGQHWASSVASSVGQMAAQEWSA